MLGQPYFVEAEFFCVGDLFEHLPIGPCEIVVGAFEDVEDPELHGIPPRDDGYPFGAGETDANVADASREGVRGRPVVGIHKQVLSGRAAQVFLVEFAHTGARQGLDDLDAFG